MSPERRRHLIVHIRQKLGVSERRACRLFQQNRASPRRKPQHRDDEERLTIDIIRLASRYGRYAYRRITALLRAES
ncbi:MAG: hypothetical protein PsegKO_33120 [Pseudohongiellaceae bacterium]